MENTTQPKNLTTPQAIVIAGVLIMIALFVTQNGVAPKKEKTLSEQVGVSKENLTLCLEKLDEASLYESLMKSVEGAMKNVPQNERGTPYTVVIGSNGVMADIRGAESYENIMKVIQEVESGTVTRPYTGTIALSEPTDHPMGNPKAPITLIEYSDYECPFCKRIHPTLERIVEESNGTVRWIYRHWPLHQNSFTKLAAAECVAQIKGDEAFWEYSELLFGLLKTGDESPTEQL